MELVKIISILWIITCLSIISEAIRSSGSVDHFLENNTEEFQQLTSSCPCDDRFLCMPLEEAKRQNGEAEHIQEYARKSEGSEVFAFVLKCDINVWSKFNWTKLTTIALAGFYDSDLVCHAHRHGVKVVKLGNIPTSQLPNATARSIWVNLQASDAALKFLDGINIDYEDPIEEGSPEQEGLSDLVKETAEVFHKFIPGSEVSIDVAWSASGIDGRYYDYKSIANYSDLIFIMAYDEQSQIFDKPCSARPNSGIFKSAVGIQSYINLGIPTEKMIFGVPWYGYNYPCISVESDGTCLIEEVPFRGANCSDAAGKEYSYQYMLETMIKYNATYEWDSNSLTPFYTIKDEEGQLRQMRYDDPRSLVYKYMLAIASGLRGVGMWTANFLDYSDSAAAEAQRNEMWELLP